VGVRVSSELDKPINDGFRGKWLNALNIGKSETEMIELWNVEHPEDPIDSPSRVIQLHPDEKTA